MHLSNESVIFTLCLYYSETRLQTRFRKIIKSDHTLAHERNTSMSALSSSCKSSLLSKEVDAYPNFQLLHQHRMHGRRLRRAGTSQMLHPRWRLTRYGAQKQGLDANHSGQRMRLRGGHRLGSLASLLSRQEKTAAWEAETPDPGGADDVHHTARPCHREWTETGRGMGFRGGGAGGPKWYLALMSNSVFLIFYVAVVKMYFFYFLLPSTMCGATSTSTLPYNWCVCLVMRCKPLHCRRTRWDINKFAERTRMPLERRERRAAIA